MEETLLGFQCELSCDFPYEWKHESMAYSHDGSNPPTHYGYSILFCWLSALLKVSL